MPENSPRDDLYLSLVAGPTPQVARPILITRDPALLRAFGEAVRKRVEDGVAGVEARRALELLDVDGTPEEGSSA